MECVQVNQRGSEEVVMVTRLFEVPVIYGRDSMRNVTSNWIESRLSSSEHLRPELCTNDNLSSCSVHVTVTINWDDVLLCLIWSDHFKRTSRELYILQ